MFDDPRRPFPVLPSLHLDGSLGEGGGQILRTSLSLSLITGKAFSIEKVRAGRSKPGLRAQHLLCLEAAARVGAAEIEGAEIGSSAFSFRPQLIQGGNYHFSVGTAGSTILVLQTLIPALFRASTPSKLVVVGGTHNAFAPPFEFFQEVYLPILRQLGATITAQLDQYGFFPRGGGQITVDLDPQTVHHPLYLHHRGPLLSRSARALVVGLPPEIATRELHRLQKKLAWKKTELTSVVQKIGPSPGNALLLKVEHQASTELISSLGEKGRPAERVVDSALAELFEYLSSSAPVGKHLADQLLLPLALGSGGSFITGPLTLHALTNIEVIKKFLNLAIYVDATEPGLTKVTVSP